MHLSRYLNFWYRRRGDQPALHCEDETLSWTDVEHASAALAAHLTDIGVKPGDRIGCLLGNSLPWCVQFVASLRSEEHTSELQSLMRISYAVFCLKKKKTHNTYIRVKQRKEY